MRRRRRLVGVLLIIVPALFAADPATFRNPVIAGFAPDPSVVRVGEDFYLVNSSFEYFPSLPIHHSRDLVNWELIGHAVTDAATAPLAQVPSSGGMQAATIRHHAGKFYIAATSIVAGKPVSFVVTATNPRGPWSPPQIIADAEGIDPSLFFDDDGRAWWTANRVPPDPAFPGQAEIWLQEFDLATLALKGPRHALSRGNSGGVWAEGPHLYKRGGWYYLLLAEGGTSFEHAVTIAAARQITGPYLPSARNPVLTHRHLSYDAPITGVGHADLVELADGRWYAVALGWRRIAGRHALLGRETLLVPVSWEDERETWKDHAFAHPVFSPATGKVELTYPLPFASATQRADDQFADDFRTPTLRPEWNLRRPPATPFHTIDAKKGVLGLALQPAAIAEGASYSFVGVRQRHLRCTAQVELRLATNRAADEAGLVIIQKDEAAFSCTLRPAAAGGGAIEISQWSQHGRKHVASLPWANSTAQLRVRADELRYEFFVSTDGKEWRRIGETLDGRLLSPSELPGFNYTGVYFGLYASANGATADGHAEFLRFRYEGEVAP